MIGEGAGMRRFSFVGQREHGRGWTGKTSTEKEHG